MNLYKKKSLAVITLVYWFLLIFIIAAWVWWFISLEEQNKQMFALQVNELQHDDFYPTKLQALEVNKERKTKQYISEGVTFLMVSLLGAVFVYRATRRQIVLSQQQQNFMMAVTHELKTPIAVTRLNLETLQKRKLEETQQKKLIEHTIEEANRLNVLTSNILVSAQLDAGAYDIAKQEINLSETAAQSVEDFIKRFPQRKIEATIDEGVYVDGEPLLLQLLVNNLIDNALKYSSASSKVKVQLKVAKGKALLSIIDEGCGIATEEKRKVFNKFYRVGDEVTRTAKGTGLGLYLCKKIVKDHNGTITLTDNKPCGSNFTVALQST